MSNKDKERVIEEMWQNQKMFDELLALILQGIMKKVGNFCVTMKSCISMIL